ncbi:MAG: hypothetical protein LBT56_04880 [Prevotellaceae bacterium]|jgi:hypothetical protein|nr:hypothetical protein [Prevotellaceae bacterium]
MRKILIISIVVLFFAGCENNDVESIKECFEIYKNSLLNISGNEAIKVVDENTIKYYSTMLEYAQTIKYNELQKLSLMNKILVLTLRHILTLDELNKMNGEKLFIWAIDYGMISMQDTENLLLKDIVIDKNDRNQAKGLLVASKYNIGYKIKFVKEQGSWKIDLTSMFNFAEKLFQTTRKQLDMTEEQFIHATLEEYGKEIDYNILYRNR